jgi:hypothetical protein
MKYAEWNNLSDDDKNNTHWKHHPRIRIFTLFSILFAIVFVVVLLRIFQNRRIHVNRKPNNKEAFAIAKVFIKDRLKQPGTANFPKNNFQSNIDTGRNSYNIASFVDAQDSTGKMVKIQWQVKLAYNGGDWADRSSWKLMAVKIQQ